MPRATYSFKMSFWIVPRQLVARDALLLGDQLVEQQQRRRRGVDRHRGRDLVEGQPPSSSAHVHSSEEIATPTLPDLALGARVIGVVAHLRGQVEGARQPGLAGARRNLKRSFVASAVPKPAYWRIVQSRPRYMEAWTPRVKGYSPGRPGRASAIEAPGPRAVDGRTRCPNRWTARLVGPSSRRSSVPSDPR